MANIVPNSAVTLYNVDSGDGARPIFASKTAQSAYFDAHVVARNVNCTYVKHAKGSLMLEVSTASVMQSNYIAFTNPAFENRIFFAEIIDFEYVNNVTTQIFYAVDWFQTYMFDFSAAPCLVERQHLTTSETAMLDANPYNREVYQMWTDEGLAASSAMQEQTLISDSSSALATSAAMFSISPASGINKDLVVMKVSDIGDGKKEDWETLLDSTCNDLLSGYIAPNGKVTGTIPTGDAAGTVLGFKIPNPCYVIIIYLGAAKTKLPKLLDWLTLYNMSSQIIGLWQVPTFYAAAWLGEQTNATPYNFVTTIPRPVMPSGISSHKLLWAPFNYLVGIGGGNTKEWQYEHMSLDSSGKYKFGIVCGMDSSPVVSVSPLGYKQTRVQGKQSFNIEERLDITSIPQLAYTTDAYLAYVGQQYTSMASSTTLPAQQAAVVADNPIGNFFKTAGASLNSLGAMITGNTSKLEETAMDVTKSTRNKQMIDYASGDITGNAIDSTFGHAKGAYANDEYHAGNSNAIDIYAGITNCACGVRYERRMIDSSIMRAYDAYFKRYGYADRRVTIPNVVLYLKGQTSPTFYDGATYCKTAGMAVTGVPKAAGDYIARVFNSGCIFYSK